MGCAPSSAVEVVPAGTADQPPAPSLSLTLEPATSSSSTKPNIRDTESFRRARKGSVEAELESMGEDVSLVMDVEGFLQSMELEQYWPAFSAAGYTELPSLRGVTEAELRRLQPPIKAGHIKKVVKNVLRLQDKMATQSPGSSMVVQMTPDVAPLSLDTDGRTPDGLRCRRKSADAELNSIDDDDLDQFHLNSPAAVTSPTNGALGVISNFVPSLALAPGETSATSRVSGGTSFDEKAEIIDVVASPRANEAPGASPRGSFDLGGDKALEDSDVEGGGSARGRVPSERTRFTARSSYSVLPEMPDGDMDDMLAALDDLTPESTPSNTPQAGVAAQKQEAQFDQVGAPEGGAAGATSSTTTTTAVAE